MVQIPKLIVQLRRSGWGRRACGRNEGQQMRLEKLEAWQALRERYGNRDESGVDQGTLLAA